MEYKKRVLGNYLSKIAIFIVWPFGSFVYSLKNLKSQSSIFIFFLFCILFGFTFLPQNEQADSFRYQEDFHNIKSYSSAQYLSDFKTYITFTSTIKDFYVLTCSFLIITISGNYHLLMALYALVFAFFYIKSFKILVSRQEFTLSIIGYILAFWFTFSNPIFNINGVRFWTAAWIAVFIIFQVVVNRRYTYAILALLTPVIHLSYFFFIIGIGIYLLTRKYERFWIFAFLMSFFITNIGLEYLGSVIEYVPSVFKNTMAIYINDDYISNKVDYINKLPTYAMILKKLPNLFINILMIIFILNNKILTSSTETKSIYYFLLSWLTLTNIFWTIPSLGTRFVYLSIPFISFELLLLYRKIAILRKIIYLIPLIYSYEILHWIRNMITVTDPDLFITTFFQLVYKNL